MTGSRYGSELHSHVAKPLEVDSCFAPQYVGSVLRIGLSKGSFIILLKGGRKGGRLPKRGFDGFRNNPRSLFGAFVDFETHMSECSRHCKLLESD